MRRSLGSLWKSGSWNKFAKYFHRATYWVSSSFSLVLWTKPKQSREFLISVIVKLYLQTSFLKLYFFCSFSYEISLYAVYIFIKSDKRGILRLNGNHGKAVPWQMKTNSSSVVSVARKSCMWLTTLNIPLFTLPVITLAVIFDCSHRK